MTYCTCWCDYPNPNHKRKNGKWLCVDKYKCVRKGDGYTTKTKCEKKREGDRNDGLVSL